MRERISDRILLLLRMCDQGPETRDLRPTYRGESPSAGGDPELTWDARGHRGARRDDHCH